MGSDDLAARLAEFRREYAASVEAGQALTTGLTPGGDLERWLEACPPVVQAVLRREQAALLRELESDGRRGGGFGSERPAGALRSLPLTPGDFAFRTMGR